MFSWLLSAPLKKKTVQFPGCDIITYVRAYAASEYECATNVSAMARQWIDTVLIFSHVKVVRSAHNCVGITAKLC